MTQVATAVPETTADSFDHIQIQAHFFKMLGDRTRLQIVMHLVEGEKNVGELVDMLGISQSRVSNHLACLRWCGLVVSRREGRSVYYRLIDERAADLIDTSRRMIADNAAYILSCTRI